MPRRAILAATLLLAAACTAETADTADSAAGAAGAAGASAAPAPASSGDDRADLRRYELSMDKVDRFYTAQRNLAVRMKDMTPAERESMDISSDPDASIDDMARKFESHPVMGDALRESGMSGREFALMTMAMIQSGMAAAVLQMRPNDDADSLMREMAVNPANVRFMQQNEAALQRKQAELKAELQRLGVDVDG